MQILWHTPRTIMRRMGAEAIVALIASLVTIVGFVVGGIRWLVTRRKTRTQATSGRNGLPLSARRVQKSAKSLKVSPHTIIGGYWDISFEG